MVRMIMVTRAIIQVLVKVPLLVVEIVDVLILHTPLG
jgi:hypothetical protein